MALECPRNRFQRQALSSPCLPVTPADSGYGSTAPTPDYIISPTPAYRRPISYRFPVLDGNRSSASSTSSEAVDDTETVNQQGLCKTPSKSTTLPRRSARSRPALPASFFSESSNERCQVGSGTRSDSRRSNSLRLPDRFVPMRDHSTSISDVFRTSKPWHQLTPSEMILRRDDATPDAFCSPRRRGFSVSSDFLARSRSDHRITRNAGKVFLNLKLS
jgi:hypothetical protein